MFCFFFLFLKFFLSFFSVKKAFADPRLSRMQDSLKIRKELKSFSLVQFVAAVCIGVTFGYFFERSNVFQPNVIQNQMLFSENSMLKIFLSAAAVSVLVVRVLQFVNPK